MPAAHLPLVEQVEQLRHGHVVHQRFGAQVVDEQQFRFHQRRELGAVVVQIGLPRRFKEAVCADIGGQVSALGHAARNALHEERLAQAALAHQEQVAHLGIGKAVRIAQADIAVGLHDAPLGHAPLVRLVGKDASVIGFKGARPRAQAALLHQPAVELPAHAVAHAAGRVVDVPFVPADGAGVDRLQKIVRQAASGQPFPDLPVPVRHACRQAGVGLRVAPGIDQAGTHARHHLGVALLQQLPKTLAPAAGFLPPLLKQAQVVLPPPGIVLLQPGQNLLSRHFRFNSSSCSSDRSPNSSGS